MLNILKIQCFWIILIGPFIRNIDAQDLIVTRAGDSLNCRITKVESNYIFFTFSYKNEIRNTLAPLSEVISYRYNFFSMPVVPSVQTEDGENYPHIRGCLYGGFSYRTAKLPDGISDYLTEYFKELKSGVHFGCDASFFFSENLGLGIKYNMFHSFNSKEDVPFEDSNGNIVRGKLSDNINIHFVGPVLNIRLPDRRKQNSLLFNLSVGYAYYKDESVWLTAYELTGNTAGIICDIDYDIKINPKFIIGLQLSFFGGSISTFNYSDANQSATINLDPENYENLARIDMALNFILNL